MNPNENPRQAKLPSTKFDAQEEMITSSDDDISEQEMLQDSRSDNDVQDAKHPSGDYTEKDVDSSSGDIIMHEVETATEVNTVQDVAYPNRDNYMESVTDTPCGHTSSQNNFRDNNCGGETSNPDNQMKSQLMIATGGIAQDRLENTNEEVETELTNRGTCRQRVTPNSYSNEEPPVRCSTFSGKLRNLRAMVRAERNSNAENVVQIQDYISIIRDILYDLYQCYRAMNNALEQTSSNYQQLRQRDRAFIEHVQINSSGKAEWIQRMQFHVNRLVLQRDRYVRSANIFERLTALQNNFSCETLESRIEIIGRINGLMVDIVNLCKENQNNQYFPPALETLLPDETLSFILPSFIIHILMGLVLLFVSTNLSYFVRLGFRRK